MGKFRGVLLASDFDGTLTDSSGSIVPRNIEAIRYFISEGGFFTISTGRTAAGFHNYSEDIINAPVLLANGAMAYDYKTQQAAFINGIGNDNLDILKRIVDKFPDISVELYGADNKTYVLNCNRDSACHFENLRINDVISILSLEEVAFPLVKVMLSVGEKTFEVQRFLDTVELGSLKYIPCSGSFVEILSKNAGKGNALLQLADILKVNSSDIYAVGDGSNDVDMLESAHTGFVPENGDAYAKKAAGIIVCDNNTGSIYNVIDILDKKYQ